MIKAIALIVVLIGLLILVGKGYNTIVDNAYERGKSEAEAVAAQIITAQKKKMAVLIQSHNIELSKSRAIRKAERRKADEQIRKLLTKYKELENWWITVVHDCAVAYIYGVHNEGCPDYVIPNRPRADSGLELPGAEDWENDKWRHRAGYEKSA